MKTQIQFTQKATLMKIRSTWPWKTSMGIAVIFLLLISSITGCDNNKTELPVLGEMVEDFNFRNQDNQLVTAEIFAGKIYITDFFFTTCPSICPIMKRQMARIYEEFKDTPEVLLFSHTIDPEHDTVEILKNFAEGLGIKTEKWQMVTGPQDEIFAMAKHYMLGAMKNDDIPGGYIHSGSFVLVDENKKIRGYYNGTDSEEVDALIADLKDYLNEK